MKVPFSCALLSLALAASAQVPSASDDFVLSGAIAYGMLSPEAITANHASGISWSDDGRYLLTRRMEVGQDVLLGGLIPRRQGEGGLERSLVVYSLKSKRATTVWRTTVKTAQVADVAWFRNTDIAVAIVEEQAFAPDAKPGDARERVILVDASSNGSREILSYDANNSADGASALDVSLSPTKPVGILMLRTLEAAPAGSKAPASWRMEYRAISPTLGLGPVMSMDAGTFVTGWTEDGASPILTSFARGSDGKYQRRQLVLDLQSGASRSADGVKAYQPPQSSDPISVNWSSGKVSLNSKEQSLRPAWLVAQEEAVTPSAGGSSDAPARGNNPLPEAMISSDVTEVVLSPTLSGVAYVSKGVAMVRPIVQVPKDALLAALKAEMKTKLLLQAKQVGLGLIMFASDNDDKLPPEQADLGHLLDPYLKNPDLMKGFVYSFTGGSMTDVESPAETIMGYVPGPGGKAVVYLDGHAKWVDDK